MASKRLIELPESSKYSYSLNTKGFKYDFWQKKRVFTTIEQHLYSFKRKGNIIFKPGWEMYIAKYNDLNFDAKNYSTGLKISEDFVDGVVDPNFNKDKFNSVQLADVNQLINFRRGLFQVYTSYGKTTVITVLTKWMLENVGKVLILTPNVASRNEIIERLKKYYEIDASKFEYGKDLNVICLLNFDKRKDFDIKNSYWKDIKVIISDEVECCVTPDVAKQILDKSENVEYCYGFSATADKQSAEVIGTKKFNDEVLYRNKELIDYFGTTLVYKKPSDEFELEIVNMKTTMFNRVKPLPQGTPYYDTLKNILTNDSVMTGIKEIVDHINNAYIPVPFTSIIEAWEEFGMFENRTYATLTTEGIKIGKEKKSVKQEEFKEMVLRGEVDFLIGTSASDRALDLHGINSILLLTKHSGTVLQQLGRVARDKKIRVINLKPYKGNATYNEYEDEVLGTSSYSKDLKERNRLLMNYYSCAKITERTVNNVKDL